MTAESIDIDRLMQPNLKRVFGEHLVSRRGGSFDPVQKDLTVSLNALRLSASLNEQNKIDKLEVFLGVSEKTKMSLRGVKFDTDASIGISGDSAKRSFTYEQSVKFQTLGIEVDEKSRFGIGRIDKTPEAVTRWMLGAMKEFYRQSGVNMDAYLNY